MRDEEGGQEVTRQDVVGSVRCDDRGVGGRAEATTQERGQAGAGREQQTKPAQGAAKLPADVHEMRSCGGAHLEGGEEEAAEAAPQGPHKHFRKLLQAVEGKESDGTFTGSSNGVALLQ